MKLGGKMDSPCVAEETTRVGHSIHYECDIYPIIHRGADENIIQAITDEISTAYSYDYGSSGSDMVQGATLLPASGTS